MISSKHRYFRVLLGSLFVSGLCSTVIDAHPRMQRYNFGRAQRQYATKRNALKRIQSQQAAPRQRVPQNMPQKSAPKHISANSELLTRAYWLSDLLRYENQRKHGSIRLDALTFEIVDPSRLGKSSEGTVSGKAQIMGDSRGNKTVHILLSSALKNESMAVQAQIILHELAHAYDSHLWNSMMRHNMKGLNFDSYPYLKEDVRLCKTQLKALSQEMIACEWYAQWQSLQWMKQYAPVEAEVLRNKYTNQAAGQRRGLLSSFQYPPAAILLKWIS